MAARKHGAGWLLAGTFVVAVGSAAYAAKGVWIDLLQLRGVGRENRAMREAAQAERVRFEREYAAQNNPAVQERRAREAGYRKPNEVPLEVGP